MTPVSTAKLKSTWTKLVLTSALVGLPLYFDKLLYTFLLPETSYPDYKPNLPETSYPDYKPNLPETSYPDYKPNLPETSYPDHKPNLLETSYPDYKPKKEYADGWNFEETAQPDDDGESKSKS